MSEEMQDAMRNAVLEAMDNVCDQFNVSKVTDADLPKLFPTIDRMSQILDDRSHGDFIIMVHNNFGSRYVGGFHGLTYDRNEAKAFTKSAALEEAARVSGRECQSCEVLPA